MGCSSRPSPILHARVDAVVDALDPAHYPHGVPPHLDPRPGGGGGPQREQGARGPLGAASAASEAPEAGSWIVRGEAPGGGEDPGKVGKDCQGFFELPYDCLVKQ